MDKEIHSGKDLHDRIFRGLRRTRPAREAKVTWPIVILLFILGAGLLAASFHFTNERLTLIRNGLRAEGIVTAIEKRETTCRNNNSGGSGKRRYCTSYVSVIGYKDNLNKDQSFTTDFSSNKPPYAMNEKVQVLYIADHPETARVHSFISMWMVPGMCGFFGFFLVYGGIRHAIRLSQSGKETAL